MKKFINKKLAIITALALTLSPKVSADANFQKNIGINSKNNLNIKENSEKSEEIDDIKILENKKHELVNNIVEILDSFPTKIYDKISEKDTDKDIDNASITGLFTMPGKFFFERGYSKIYGENSEEKIYKERKEFAYSMLETMTYIKENTSPEILSRISIDIFEDNSENKFISKEDHLYTLTGITIPEILRYFQDFDFNDRYSDPNFKFDFKSKTLDDSIWNSNNLFASFIINNDESLTIKFRNNNKVFLQFTIK